MTIDMTRVLRPARGTFEEPRGCAIQEGRKCTAGNRKRSWIVSTVGAHSMWNASGDTALREDGRFVGHARSPAARVSTRMRIDGPYRRISLACRPLSRRRFRDHQGSRGRAMSLGSGSSSWSRDCELHCLTDGPSSLGEARSLVRAGFAAFSEPLWPSLWVRRVSRSRPSAHPRRSWP